LHPGPFRLNVAMLGQWAVGARYGKRGLLILPLVLFLALTLGPAIAKADPAAQITEF
jgi:hypothetical protein